MKRIITGVVMLVLAVPIFVFAETWVLPIIASLLSVTAAYEILKCIECAGKYRLAVPLYVYALILPPMTRLCTLHLRSSAVYMFAVLATLVLVLYLFAIMMFSKGKLVYREISEAFMTILYTTAGFSGMIYLYDHAGQNGLFTLLLVCLAAFSTDIFAYFGGRLFGRHKLIPEISPKKTVEGSISGIVFCVLMIGAYGFLLKSVWSIQVNFPVLLISGVLMSVVAQIGDLIMSAIKRSYGVKDFGKIFPGHGGVLDRFDSAIAVAIILLPIETLFGLFTVV